MRKGLTTSSLEKNQLQTVTLLAIDEATFLKVYDIKAAHPVSGTSKNVTENELPLKVFARDAVLESPFTGYLNKLKNIYYYNTRKGEQK
ncbi:MAG: hypothetical protein KGZ74_13670 [Chitinophagaceae bacterium]|nr:hypothetical protein [Chitinophagaceae bacterium]